MKKWLGLLLALSLLLLCAVPVSLAEEAAPEAFTSGDYRYIVLEDGSAEIVRYTGKEKNLAVPGTLDGKPVSSIGEDAFTMCESLASVEIPDSVKAVGANPFTFCRNLADLYVSPDHPYLAVAEGVLFSKPDNRLVCCPSAFTAAAYAIPDGTRAIGDHAFHSCDSLLSVTIPDSVEEIGDEAFYNCDSLTSATIPDSVRSVGANPFAFCQRLADLYVSPDHPYLATAGGVLFSKPDKRLVCYPPALTAAAYEIPDGIRLIGDKAFFFCRSLESVTIPAGVTGIGSYAFGSCESLSSAAVPDGVAAIAPYAFFGCASLASVTLPDSVESIGEGAFYSCGVLPSVEIPESVVSIGPEAFAWCGALQSAALPESVTSIGERAFFGCESLTMTVPRDSFAKQYCVENGIRYTYPDAMDWLKDE